MRRRIFVCLFKSKESNCYDFLFFSFVILLKLRNLVNWMEKKTYLLIELIDQYPDLQLKADEEIELH